MFSATLPTLLRRGYGAPYYKLNISSWPNNQLTTTSVCSESKRSKATRNAEHLFAEKPQVDALISDVCAYVSALGATQARGQSRILCRCATATAAVCCCCGLLLLVLFGVVAMLLISPPNFAAHLVVILVVALVMVRVRKGQTSGEPRQPCQSSATFPCHEAYATYTSNILEHDNTCDAKRRKH